MTWTAWQRVPDLELKEVIYEKKHHSKLGGGVARVAINRPEKYNAFTNQTQDEMFKAFYDASHDPAIGAIVLTGAGDKAFCTGGDVAWEKWGLREQMYWRYSPNRLVRLSRKPVIAAVKGFCIGGGNHLAYCCDFTIAADNAIFGQNGPRVSSPADGYVVSYLTNVVGAKKARELWMLCRRYSAQEALEMGLINAVAPLSGLEAEVDRWCEDILSLSPGCVEVLKASFDMEIDRMQQLGLMGSWLYPDWFESNEGKEGSAAFTEKRKPDFWAARNKDIAGRSGRS